MFERGTRIMLLSFVAVLISASLMLLAGCSDAPDTSAPERVEVERSADWQGALLYIADENGPTAGWGSIRVYDNVSRFVEKTVEQTRAAAPADVFVTPDGSTMYVAGSNGIIGKFRWDGSNWKDNGRTIETPSASLAALVPGPDGKVYAAGKDSEGAGVIYSFDPVQDTQGLKPVTAFQDMDVSGLAWSRDGSKLVVAGNGAGGAMLVVEQWPSVTGAGQSIALPLTQVHEIVTSPDGRFVYVMGRGGISVVDAASLKVTGSLKPAPEPDADYYDAAFSADNNFMFTAATAPGGDGTLYVIELATGNVVNTVKHISVKPNGMQRVE